MTLLVSVLMMGGPKINLDGHTLGITTNTGAAAVQELSIRDAGTVTYRENSGSWIGIDTTTDWIRAVAFAPGLYQARYTNPTGDTGNLSCAQAAVDTWFALSGGDLIMYLIDDTAGAGTISVTFDLEIRHGGSGGALRTGSYTMRCDRIDA